MRENQFWLSDEPWERIEPAEGHERCITRARFVPRERGSSPPNSVVIPGRHEVARIHNHDTA